MIEALTAFALAGNVLQFIEVGIKLLRKASEINKSAHGQTQDFMEMKNANKILLEFNIKLASDLGQQKHPIPDHLVSLTNANERCRKLADEYLTLLSRLQLTGPAPTLASFRMAWKTLQSKEKLVRIEQRRQDLKSDLSLALMTVVQHEVANNHGQSMRRLEDLKASMTSEIDRIGDSTIQAVTRTEQSLAEKIGNLSVNDNDLQSKLATFHVASNRMLLDLVKKVENIQTGCKTMADNQARVYEFMINQITAQERVRETVLSTLRFSLMSSRRSQIVTAHSQTFRWILKPKLDGSNVWDDFIAWLNDEATCDLYWVQGKPGSGKSTLMKYLEQYLSHHEMPARQSGKTDRFAVASYYFWNVGDRSQRSISGLLRNLLHSILQAIPSQIKDVLQRERWASSSYSNTSSWDWTNEELFDTLIKALKLLSDRKHIFLLVDGLDEIEANDEERLHLIRFFKKLTNIRLAKICVSSRSWQIFKDEFEDFPQLLLEDLTKADIQLYTRDTLSADRQFKRFQQTNPSILDELCNIIVTKAQGVFLWVRLAVRELISEVRDGAKANRLLETLRNIPGDLDAFFLRILHSVDAKYRRDGAILLQLAVCDLRSKRWTKGGPRPEGPSLKMFHLEFLDQRHDPDFIKSMKSDLTSQISRKDFQESCADRQRRRIVSRGMGLLETTRPANSTKYNGLGRPSTSTNDDILGIEITFLHRTVRDWLLTPSASEILKANAGGDFDAHLFRCGTLVLESAARHARGLKFEVADFIDSLTCLICQVPLRHSSSDLFQIFEHFIGTSLLHLNDTKSFSEKSLLQARDTNIWRVLNSHDINPIATNAKYPELNELIDDVGNRSCTPWTIAVQLGWADYVSAKCITTGVLQSKGRPLLDYVLRPCLSVPSNPNLEAAASVIQYARDSMDKSSFAVTLRSVWPRFLVYICYIKNLDREACLKIFKLLLQKPFSNFQINPERLLMSDGAQAGPYALRQLMETPSIFTKALRANRLHLNGSPQKVIEVILCLTHVEDPDKFLFDSSELPTHSVWSTRKIAVNEGEEYITSRHSKALLFDDDDSDSDCPDESNEDVLKDDEWVMV